MGDTQIRVGSGPITELFDNPPTVVAAGGPWDDPTKVPQNYGGYIMPGATLDNMGILISQWNTSIGAPYAVEQFQVHPHH